MPLLGATGGNMEPMTFMRSFGPKNEAPAAPPPPEFDMSQIYGAAPPPPPMAAIPNPPQSAISNISNGDEDHHNSSSPKKHKRERSRDRKDRKKRSRSRDRKKRSRSRDRKKRSKRSRSRSKDRRSRSRSRRSRSRSRRIKQEKEDASYNESLNSSVNTTMNFSINEGTSIKMEPNVNASGKKRKSRWGDESDKTVVPGLPTIIPANLTEDQRRAYLLQLQIEEVSRNLRAGGNLGINPDPSKRSPSPEPVYDVHGKRLNTREVRTRQKLEQMRHDFIGEMMRINPMYKPPQDYKAPVIRLHDKVWIPQDDHPEINFVGLLIGPRGNTLKSLERDTGAKIIIRGKGSVKEGKLKRDGPLPGEDEPLHAYITATDPGVIQKASHKIKEILSEALEVPESQNELRKLQLRELAVLNGTLRPEDLVNNSRCSNCGANTHKSWECPDAPNVTANIFCTKCGGAGHISKDCINPAPGGGTGGIFPGAAGGLGGSANSELDQEYSALMAELGQDPGISKQFGSVRVAGMSHGMANHGGRDRNANPEPIMRVNLTQNRPKPVSLMSINVAPPPIWGAPPPPPSNNPADAHPPNAVGITSGAVSGYNFGAPPPPPPPDGGGHQNMYSHMMSGWGMAPAPPPPPPAPVPPPPNSSAGHGLDLSALLTAPAPPPPPPPQ